MDSLDSCNQWTMEVLWGALVTLSFRLEHLSDDGAVQWEKDPSWGGGAGLRRELRGGWIKSCVCWVWGDCRTSGYLVGGWIYSSIGQRKDPGWRTGQGCRGRERGEETREVQGECDNPVSGTGEPWERKSGHTWIWELAGWGGFLRRHCGTVWNMKYKVGAGQTVVVRVL